MTTSSLDIVVEFTGGLELLFSNIRKHKLSLPATFTVKDLVAYLVGNLMQDKRKEMFVLEDGAVRPGILVLVNDADWELEGGEDYRLRSGDNILFVSTLHGG